MPQDLAAGPSPMHTADVKILGFTWWVHEEQSDISGAANTDFSFLLYSAGKIYKQRYSHYQMQVPAVHI